MEIFYEVTGSVNVRLGHLIEKSLLSFYKGFRTVYGFQEDSLEYFREIGGVRGTKGLQVYGDELFIDIDNDDQEAEKVFKILVERGYRFEMYFSGSKGYHFLLFHEPMISSSLPHSHKKWVESHDIRCDWSIYQSGRLIRLPGTIHQKTGKEKVLIESNEGSLIQVPLIEAPIAQPSYSSLEDGSEANLLALSSLLNRFVEIPIGEGCRNNRLFSIGKSFFSSGMSGEATQEFLELLNSLIESPIPDEELELITKSITK